MQPHRAARMFRVYYTYHYIIDDLCAVALPDLQVVLRHDDGAAPGDSCTGVLAVAMRVISLPQVLVGCTLSDNKQKRVE